MRPTAIHFGLLLALLAATVGCGQQQPSGSSAVPAQSVLKRGLGGEPASLDPATAVDTFSTQVLQDLYEGLTVESSSGQVTPGVAASWKVDASGTHYTFQLRSDARWSNGQRIRAQDFATAWKRVLDPKQGSPVANDLRLIVGATEIMSGKSPSSSLGVATPSDDVLVVDLVQPAPFFPELVAHSVAFPIYSQESARSHTADNWVSNGPYVLSNWQPGTRIVLKRNKTYWDEKSVPIEMVDYEFAPDQNAQFAAYRAGQLDMTDTIPANAIESIRAAHPKEVVIAPYLATAYYGLNVEQAPFKGNQKLRQALAMAIDRQRLVAALGLGQIQAFGIVPPSSWNYTPQRWPWETLSSADRVAAARKLYAQAGYSTTKPLGLRVLYNSNPEIKQTALIIAAMWKDTLGIDTELIDEEFRVYLQSRHDKKKWDVVRLAWNADYNDASNFLEIFRSDSANNDTGYNNPAFDRLLDKAGNSADPNVRRDLLEAAEKTMLDDYPVIPIYFLVSKRLVKPYVVGVNPNPLDRLPSRSISILPH
jgi:oligopeptide transport system substrate-binding protein